MKAIWIILLLILPLSQIAAQDGEGEGDEKIKDTIRKIQEEAEKAPEEEDSWDDEEDEDDGCSGCQLIGEFFFEFAGELFWEYLVLISFAPYPYAPEVDYDFSTIDYQDLRYRKVTSLQVGTDLATHLDGTYGNTNRLTGQLSGVQLNLFNQTIFARSVSLSALSLNLGLSLLIGSFDLSGFVGTYLITTTGTFRLSTGLSSRVFFPGNLYLDVYGLYAFLSADAGILHLLASLNFAVWRFSIGVGYNYNLIVDDVYAGPCVKVSFWL
jgi:hypothetical protein